MKRALTFIALMGAIVLAGCGGVNDTTGESTFNNGSGNQPFKPTTHLTYRSVVSNYYAGHLQVMDALQDRLTTFTFNTGTQPTYLQPSQDCTLTFVNNTGSNSLSSLNNNSEAVKATINLGGSTQSFVTSVNNKAGFAAVPNFSNGSFRVPGAIVRFNPTDGSLNTQIPFPNVSRVIMDPAEKHLLAFTNANSFAYWVDLTTIDPSTLVPVVYQLSFSDAGGTAINLSNPNAAYFSADSSKVYILSCGTECGGVSAPSVTQVNLNTLAVNITTHTGTATIVNEPISVPGARIGLIDNTANKLYVAGSTTTLPDAGGNIVQDGYFTTIDLTNTSPGYVPPSIRIGNGVKRWIRNINGVYWVASLSPGVQSGISMVNPSAGTATVLSNARGDATGISYQQNSGEVYTIEGGDLYIYTQQGTAIVPFYNTDVKGQASDVLYIDYDTINGEQNNTLNSTLCTPLQQQ